MASRPVTGKTTTGNAPAGANDAGLTIGTRARTYLVGLYATDPALLRHALEQSAGVVGVNGCSGTVRLDGQPE